ncbi:Rho-type GTPase activating protein Rga1, partial [Linderina macrospora]
MHCINAWERGKTTLGLQHTREPKLLCKRIVSFFSVLSHTQSNESNGLTQELLSLITSLAHYLKVLTRVALKGALKAQTEYECPSSIMALLSRLMETSDRHKWAMFRLSYQQTDIASDCCASCRSEVETECIEYTRRTKRWHLYCFVCSSCNCEIQHMYPQSAHDDKTGQLYCPDCAARKGLQPGGFKFVSQLEQYSFLMRVALKRLYSLLKMKSALENPDMMRHRKAGKNRAIAAVSDRSEASKSPEGSHASSEKDLVERQAAANNEFDAALASMDMSAPTSLQASSEQRTLQEAERELQVATSIGQAQSLNLTDTTSPLSPEVATAVADAAVKAARQEGGIVQMRETDNSLSPPQVLADRRKTRVAHTTVYTVKARLENSQQDGYADMPGQSSQTTLQAYHQTSPQMQQTMRRAGHIATPVGMSVNALAAQAGSGSSAGAVASKPSKLRRTSDENDQSAAHAATNAAEAATRVKTMLSRPHTMRFLSDLNTAELFCAKHVAVARLSALLCATEFSQADLVALIGTPKKQTPVGMWSRLKTNLKKKDVAGSSANGGDKERLRTATFGVSLETLMDRQSVETEMGAHGKQKLAIPQFFEVMLNTLSSMDLAVEGIFRKNGNIRRLREVTEAVDKDYSRVDLKKDTPVQIAALLKKFLRELPDPLVP